MGNLLIINGSPRAPRSNSKKYADIFHAQWDGPADEYLVTEQKHEKICAGIDRYEHLLFVFPLYADGLPVPLMRFLKVLEQYHGTKKPAVHVLINCGFLEPEQNVVAVDMMRLFCQKNGYRFGMALCVGSGEAILTTPFAGRVARKIRKLAKAVKAGESGVLKVTMPLPKRIFIRASTGYWLGLGKQNGLDRAQMETMQIEGK